MIVFGTAALVLNFIKLAWALEKKLQLQLDSEVASHGELEDRDCQCLGQCQCSEVTVIHDFRTSSSESYFALVSQSNVLLSFTGMQ